MLHKLAFLVIGRPRHFPRLNTLLIGLAGLFQIRILFSDSESSVDTRLRLFATGFLDGSLVVRRIVVPRPVLLAVVLF